MRLSLCIATFNEEKNIHYPLDSAYYLVDEVIIVDGGSTDKTVERAKAYGKKVKIIKAPNPSMFHINKQKAIDAAGGEWILQLDADEVLSEELKEEILTVISSKSETRNPKHQNAKNLTNSNLFRASNFDIRDFAAYWIPRKNWFLTRFLTKGGQYPDYTVRLYRNRVAKFPLKSVHENVEIIRNVIPAEAGIQKKEKSYIDSHFHGNDKIGYLKNPILHYADPDFSRYLKRWDRYTSLDAEILSKKLPSKSYRLKIWMFIDYFVIKPKLTFYSMYFRHLGFKDGFPGFVFALFSAIRFWVIYIKFFTLRKP